MTTGVLLILFALLIVLTTHDKPRPHRRSGVQVIRTSGLADGYVPPSASLAPPVIEDIDD